MAYVLPQPSSEQAAIVDAVLRGENVIVEAVAGSGKSSTVLFVARSLHARTPSARVLQLCFSRPLMEECEIKVAAAGLAPTVHTRTIHAFGNDAFGAHFDCKDDGGLLRILRERPPLTRAAAAAPYDLLVVDECQDVTFELYATLSWYVESAFPAGSARAPPQFLILGDARQAVYGFRGADPRFLSLAHRVWPRREARPWTRLPLSVSYRLTPPMAAFISAAVLPARATVSGVAAQRGGGGGGGAHVPVHYYAGSAYTAMTAIGERLIRYFKRGTIAAADVMVLSNTVKRSSKEHATPIERLEVTLRKAGFAVFLNELETPPTAELMAGKLVITSSVSAKGRERPIVVVVGVSSWYAEAYRVPPDERGTCPPCWYVALTRASRELHIVGEDGVKSTCAEFIDGAALARLVARGVVVHGIPPKVVRPAVSLVLSAVAARQRARVIEPLAVTDLLRYFADAHLPPGWMDALALARTTAPPDALPLDGIASHYRTAKSGGAQQEFVGDVNGTLVAALVEARATAARTHLEAEVHEALRSVGDTETLRGVNEPARAYLEHAALRVGERQRERQLLAAAIVRRAQSQKMIHGLVQLPPPECGAWLHWPDVDAAAARLHADVATLTDARFEVDVSLARKHVAGCPDDKDHVVLTGRVDAVSVSAGRLFEFKCVSADTGLSPKHVLQLALYAHMWHSPHAVVRHEGGVIPHAARARVTSFVLHNGMSGEMLTLDASTAAARARVADLVQTVLTLADARVQPRGDDDTFVETVLARAAQRAAQLPAVVVLDTDGVCMDDD